MAAWMFNKADTTISFAVKANFVSYLVFITIATWCIGVLNLFSSN